MRHELSALRVLVAAKIMEARLEWRHHQAGMLQAYITPNWRIHIHHPELKTQSMADGGDIHDHRFSFASTVLLGTLNHDVYDLKESLAGKYQVYEVAHTTGEKHETPILNSEGTTRYNATMYRHVVRAGQTYYFGHQQFHQ